MPEALPNYLARAAVSLPPLAELEHSGALSALTDMVGAARIVALGESFHHTHEQLVLREHFVRHLVSHCGFNTLILEVVTPGPNAIDSYVRAGVGSAESALIAAGARMWRNQETSALINWLREHNRASPTAPVSIHGLDVMAIGPAMRNVLAHTHSIGSQHIEKLSRGFDIDGRADQTAYNQLHANDRTLLERTFDAALTALSTQESRFRDSLGDATFEATREQATIVRDALEMLRVGADGWLKGFALRDAAMASATWRLIDRVDADAKFIILSHNTHIATEAALTEPSHPPMGSFLRARYGADYVAIGLAFGGAHFDPPIYGIADFAGEPGTADHALSALNHPVAFVDLRGADQDQALRLQGVGVGPLPYSEFPRLSAFDALAYVDVLTNARQLVDTELTMDANAVDATRA